MKVVEKHTGEQGLLPQTYAGAIRAFHSAIEQGDPQAGANFEAALDAMDDARTRAADARFKTQVDARIGQRLRELGLIEMRSGGPDDVVAA